MEEAHLTIIPTNKFAPKAARVEMSRELGRLWHNLAANMGDKRLWVLEAIFARCILPACRGPRAGDALSQAKVVRERLRRWRAGEYMALWREAVELCTRRPKRGRQRGGRDKERTQEQKNGERARVLAQEGEYSRGLQALTSSGMAPQNPTTEAILRAKHPPASSNPGPTPTSEAPPLSITPMEVEKAVKKFRRGSVPGPSGLRPEHVKGALKAPPNRSDKALSGLTKLVNNMLAGKVPPSVAPYLCGARLHAAIKKDGGLRPIAVGNLARRITAKCAASRVAEKALVHLSPLQLGVAVHGGCEAIANAVRETLEREPDKLLLQADFINAFNTMDRGKVLEEVASFSPELLPWVVTVYGTPSHLQYGTSLIPSTAGLQQGDALASFLFSLALHPIIKQVELQVPSLALHVWFLEDGTAVGTKEELQKVVDIVEKEGAGRGLVLSTAATAKAPSMPKSTVWSPLFQDQAEEQDPLQRGVPVMHEAGCAHWEPGLCQGRA